MNRGFDHFLSPDVVVCRALLLSTTLALRYRYNYTDFWTQQMMIKDDLEIKRGCSTSIVQNPSRGTPC